jgi:hypothetical protein
MFNITTLLGIPVHIVIATYSYRGFGDPEDLLLDHFVGCRLLATTNASCFRDR